MNRLVLYREEDRQKARRAVTSVFERVRSRGDPEVTHSSNYYLLPIGVSNQFFFVYVSGKLLLDQIQLSKSFTSFP